jgi:hypothetical protein
VGSVVVPGYTDLSEVGRGGFAVVYRARRTAFDQVVAIKLLTGTDVDDTALARFARERRAMGALAQHPYIVTVYDGGVAPGERPYLVMEYLPGGSLHDRLRRDGPAGVPLALDVGVKVAGALETAHRAGVLHRDVKPANVLLSRYGDPLLADFGIARMSGASVTASGVVTASLAHAPPEVLDGEPATATADVYSLASTLFCLLTGHAPFVRSTDESMAPLLVRIFRDPVPDLRGRGVPPAVCAALERAMAKDPADRPASAAEFGHELRRVQADLGLPPSALVVEGLQPAPVPPPTRRVPPPPEPAAPRTRWRRTVLIAVAVAVLVAGGITAVVLTNGATTTTTTPVAGPTGAGADDLQALLLEYRDFAPGGAQLDPPTTGIASMYLCRRIADESGKVAEAKRSLSPGDAGDYVLDTYVARFSPAAAAPFLDAVRSAATGCEGSGDTTLPQDVPPPPGGDDAVRVTGDRSDEIWVRRGDHVVAVHVRFFVVEEVDADVAPDLAARAVAVLAQGAP